MVSLGGTGSFMLSSLSSVTLQEEGLVFSGWTQPGGHILGGGGQVTQRNRSSLLVHMVSPFLPPPPKGAPAAPPHRSLPGAQCQVLFPGSLL